MKFVDFVCFEAIILRLNAADRDGVIAELVAVLDGAGQIPRGKRREIIQAGIG
jgi:hypothetical protein